MLKLNLDVRALSLFMAFAAVGVADAQALGDAAPEEAFRALSTPTSPGTLAGAATSLYFDNDGTFVRPNDNTDRHYTSGQGLSLAWAGKGENIARALGRDAGKTAVGVSLIQQIFTPDNIALPPASDDRSYAGLLLLGGFWQHEQRDVLDHVQLDLGVIGPSSLAELTQESIHDLFDADDPNYDDQLEDQFQINLALRRKWRLDLGETSLGGVALGSQLLPRVDVEVGTTYRRVSSGALFRVGYQLPDDFGPGRLTDLASATGSTFAGRDAGLSVYAFGGAVARYVDFNALLDTPQVDTISFVGEFSAGLAVEWKRYGLHTRLAYQQTLFTREFETQDGENTVGSIALQIGYSF